MDTVKRKIGERKVRGEKGVEIRSPFPLWNKAADMKENRKSAHVGAW